MIIVTGGAGFIGSNIVKTLNQQGMNNILVVDDLTDGTKFKNISDCDILDYMDKDEFIKHVANNQFSTQIDGVFHQGACSATTEWDGRFMMQNNYEYSKVLLHFCLSRQIPFIYASSASVYGAGTQFKEARENEKTFKCLRLFKIPIRPIRKTHDATSAKPSCGFTLFQCVRPKRTT